MMSESTSMHGKRECGSVLIIVLWVSVGLVAIVLTFGHSMMMAYQGADNDLAGKQADQAVEGGLRYAETLLLNAGPGVLPDPTTYQAEAVPVGDGTFWFLGRDNNNPATPDPVFQLQDEASKMNLNTATQAMLTALPGMTDDISAGIVNWRSSATSTSSNSTSSTGGADSSYYMAQQPPYIAKQAPFESVEELALVYGMNSVMLYGEDANLNGALDPNEDDGTKSDPPDNSNGTLEPGLFEYVTVFTREPATAADGSTKANVASMNLTNSADPVYALISKNLSASEVDSVMNALRANGGAVPKSVLEFYVRSGLSAADFAKIESNLTASTGQYATGLVNLSTASQTVLTCLPGMTTQLAAAIISARQGQSTTSGSITWAADLIKQQVGAAAAAQMGPYVTAKSYQVMADIVGLGRNGRGFRRTRFVIDMSSGTPTVVYRRDVSHLGWALGRNGRQSYSLRGTGS